MFLEDPNIVGKYLEIRKWGKVLSVIDNIVPYEQVRCNMRPFVKGKVDFPQIGFEKRTTERGFSKVSKSV